MKKNKLKNLIRKNLRILLMGISFLIFGIIFYLLWSDQIHEFDTKIYDFFKPMISGNTTFLFRIITATGGTIFLVVLTALLVLTRKNRYTKIAIPFNLLLVTLLNLLIKEIVGRPRPELIGLIKESGYSFPSGHAMVNTAFYGFIIYLIYQYEPNHKKRNLLCMFFSIVVLGICSSRIYLGVHYASDVVAGVCIGIIYLAIFTKIYQTIRDKNSKEETDMELNVKETKRVFDGFLKIDKLEIELPNGEKIQRELVYKKDATAIIAIDENDNVLLTKQPRVGNGKLESVEIPAGLIEVNEEPLVAAKRELLEETGYASENWTELTHFYPDPACCCSRTFLFLAQGAKKVSELNLDPDEFLEAFSMKRQELEKMLQEGKIYDVNTLLALYEAKKYI